MSTDYTQLITSEHNQKPKFVALVGALTGAVGQITDLVQTFPSLYDVDTAVGSQLDAVGLWVGQPRVVANVITKSFFGFNDTPSSLPFGEVANPNIGGPFFDIGDQFQTSTTLADPDYRLLIRAAIVRNQYDGSFTELEAALMFVFGVPCIVTDNGSMSISIAVTAPVTQVQQAILLDFDILPRPAGVRIASISFVTPLAGNVHITTGATGHL